MCIVLSSVQKLSIACIQQMHTANASSSCINFIGGTGTINTAMDSFCLAGTSAAIVKVSF